MPPFGISMSASGGARAVVTPPTPLSPDAIPGLLAWFDADSTYVARSGPTVASWTSRDPNAYVISAFNSPQWNATDFLGLPSISFSSATSTFLQSASGIGLAAAITPSAAYTAYSIISPANTALVKVPWSTFASGLNNQEFRIGGNEALSFRKRDFASDNTNTSTLVAPIAPCHNAIFFDGNSTSFRLNGVAGTGGLNNSQDSSLHIRLNIGRGQLGDAFDGKIAEIIFFNHVLTVSEIASLEAWIVAKYSGI